ncbi:MAG: M13 family metallopeptidase [Geothrix sp.]|uniref:M13 family metallopeptidase n=1 Tax=Geothrix sp. TaxID=1962974 RepID=UPI0017EDD5F9|nr:M13 family metallopeptidase [Geothrix sp.]NWJ40197.1 M13 family metallopeptidase [Geothrix sp.]WIL21795.1 MAG: M13 family metallopeptidase [Geothrix sp.]
MRLSCLALPLVASLALNAQLPYKGFNPANLDPSVKPTQDFFQFAVGSWAKRTTIPAEYDRYGVDQEIDTRTHQILREIMESAAAAKAARGSETQKVGDFFASGMDEKTIEAKGIAPLKSLFARIDGVKDAAGLAAVLADLHRVGAFAAFSFSVEQDDKESSRYSMVLGQGGLGLPDRDYYLKDDPKSRELLAAYRAHVAKTLSLAGLDPKDADRILTLETRLAKASMTRVEQRDPNAIYHAMTPAQLDSAAPGFPSALYLKALGVPTPDRFVVRQPAFLAELGRMIQELPADQWRVYLRWTLLRSSASALPKAFEEEAFAFYGTRLQGTTAQHPRWKRVMFAADRGLGEALGKLYVQRAFPASSKAKVLEMVENLRTALKARIEGLEWMSAPTKVKAKEKLAAIRVKIGYPDVWRDYAKLDIQPQPYVLNVLETRRFEFQRRLANLGRPIDRNEWDMTPQTNNAYYSPTMNEIVFPAGILQPPYFDATADDAVNYGNIGATIGHEMTHGFDDEGRQYDADGNLKSWWTAEDEKAYNLRAELVAKQFDAYEPLPGLHLNGHLTLGENIADLGGLKIAWDAWKLSQKGKPAVGRIEGFTPEQRFFLGYAETWRTLTREEATRLRANTDPHSPAKFRVNGPLSNLPEFFDAFGCKDGDPMKRPEKDRPAIW